MLIDHLDCLIIATDQIVKMVNGVEIGWGTDVKGASDLVMVMVTRSDFICKNFIYLVVADHLASPWESRLEK